MHDSTVKSRLQPGTISGEPALAVDAERLARMLGVSLRHLRRLDASGKLPRPVKLGRSVRWPVAEIEDWLADGSPDRAAWDDVKHRCGDRRILSATTIDRKSKIV